MAHDTLYAIGEALIDMIPAETGCDFGAVSSFAPRVGGAPANVAAAFARLGGRSALLTQLEQLQPGVALALNQHILPRDRWEDHLLQEGDRVLLFQVIAGG